ncbi:hypothetical protein KDH_76070 [Dictyobacter sp. S3.2.2.5]|uniref:Uncharacterized protein n=1 Tax=Dictyobacter halimunensis TaxID=3026934 RepID=A0ABQ6G2M5_9CHLR|nr:hypothetical protein KDH_76070 [Dictyobacter sp. S3.2.2.5]
MLNVIFKGIIAMVTNNISNCQYMDKFPAVGAGHGVAARQSRGKPDTYGGGNMMRWGEIRVYR